MFCPNCAANNIFDQLYCRTCGLKLEAIAAELADQIPTAEYAEMQRRRERFEKLGVATLALFALIGMILLLSKIFYAKMLLFGPEALFWSATIAMLGFGILSIFFFNYPKVAMKMDKVNPRLPSPEPLKTGVFTNKLLADALFEPASVTEHSTELLRAKKQR